jgi:hypothetical protein
MLHAETLDKFIQQKVQNYLDKDVANRHGRAGRIGNVARAGEEKDSETPLPKGLEKVVSREVNPKFLDFQEKFNELLAETKEINHGKFLLEDFELVESAEVYPVFFKLISAE